MIHYNFNTLKMLLQKKLKYFSGHFVIRTLTTPILNALRTL